MLLRVEWFKCNLFFLSDSSIVKGELTTNNEEKCPIMVILNRVWQYHSMTIDISYSFFVVQIKEEYRESSHWTERIHYIIISWVIIKPSKTIFENNLRYLRYYSHLFSQHCFNNKKQCTSRKKNQKCAAKARTRAVWASHCSLML